MERALDWRRRAFLLAGIPCLFFVLYADTIAGIFDQRSDPDAITVGAWLFMAVDLGVLLRVLFAPSQVQKMHERLAARKGTVSLVEMAKSLSILATSFVTAPLLVGLVLVMISGDAWRLYVFVPISLIGGFKFWRRIEEALRHLQASVTNDLS